MTPTPEELLKLVDVVLDDANRLEKGLLRERPFDFVHHQLATALRARLTDSAPGVEGRGDAIGHDKAQELIATHVRQIQILAEQFGYDPAEWLNEETAQNA